MKKILVGALVLISQNLYPVDTFKPVDKPTHRHHRHHRHTHSTDNLIPCLGMDQKQLYDIMTKAIATALKKEIEKRAKENDASNSGFFMRCATNIISAIVGIIGKHFLPF